MSAPDLPDVEVHAQQAIAEITEMIAEGALDPGAVGSFADLHEHLDANTLGGICNDGFPQRFGTDEAGHMAWLRFGDRVFDRVDDWLQAGHHR